MPYEDQVKKLEDMLHMRPDGLYLQRPNEPIKKLSYGELRAEIMSACAANIRQRNAELADLNAKKHARVASKVKTQEQLNKEWEQLNKEWGAVLLVAGLFVLMFASLPLLDFLTRAHYGFPK